MSEPRKFLTLSHGEFELRMLAYVRDGKPAVLGTIGFFDVRMDTYWARKLAAAIIEECDRADKAAPPLKQWP